MPPTNPSQQNTDIDKRLKERFAQLPKPVQDAITSADVEKRLRDLADSQKLHLDQWQSLENEVMLALLGVEELDDLQKNIEKEVGVRPEVARELTESIMTAVFEPIREELERQLGHPQAQNEELSEVERLRQEMLAREPAQPAQTPISAPAESTAPSLPSMPTSAPATPLPETSSPAVSEKVVRAPASGAYKPGETSATRADIHDDPYREPPK